MSNRKSVCLITGGYSEKNLRLQPWRYLSEIALQLHEQGHKVTVVTDGADTDAEAADSFNGLTLRRIPSVNRYRWHANDALQSAVEESTPDVILWHLGLPSFVHQRIDGWPDVPVLGIFPGLIYRPHELLRLGIGRIAKGYKLSAIHVAGLMVPKDFVKRPMIDGRLAGLVVQTEATSQRLLENGLHANHVRVIPPGVDEIWGVSDQAKQRAMRQHLGYTEDDTVVLFFGSPAPLRGLHTLIRAVTIARRQDPSLKLLVLNRRRRDELLQEDAELRLLLEDSDMRDHIHVISGFMQPQELTEHVDATDIVALPFELVPADAPLSVLEAKALGKPVVTTRVASLPEMAAGGVNYLAEPADPHSLAQALLEASTALGRTGRENGASPRPPMRSWRKVGEEWSQLIQAL